jgi:hypothetical protein
MAKPSSLSLSLSLSLSGDSIIQRVKEGYLIWINISPHIAKGQRYSIGTRIENKFLDLLENSYITYFTEKDKKLLKISDCILNLDTLKFLIHTTWEAKLISHNQYKEVAIKLEEIGRMFGGWKKSLENPEKKNHTL